MNSSDDVDMERLLPGAMIPAERAIPADITYLREHSVPGDLESAESSASRSGMNDFLPFAGTPGDAATFLRGVRERGGTPVRAYKTLSYRLLDVQPGMRVLDVGCGTGNDLAELAQLVGERGIAVGMDHNARLVEQARALLEQQHIHNAWVFEDDAEHMRFTEHEYDRVRADRAVQHMAAPQAAIAEMWRVLRPGGKLTLIEPDWSTMAVFPASASGGDDDTVFGNVLAWCRRHLAHPHIGRQLLALLRHVGGNAWSEVQVMVQTFTYTSWSECDAVLQLSQAATMLKHEQPTAINEIDDWLGAIEMTSAQGDFFAAVPLFFAYAMRGS